MRTGQRFITVISGAVLSMAVMAFLTLRVPSMASLQALAFLVFYLLLLGGLVWAFRPLAARMSSRVARYLVQSLGVILSFLVIAFFSYNIFLHFCVIIKWLF